MGYLHSGASIVDQTFDAETDQDASDAIADILESAGWEKVSGYGTSDCILRSGESPQGLSACLRIKQSNTTGNPYGLVLGNAANTLWPANPADTKKLIKAAAGVSYRLVCSPFWAWCFTPGAWTVERTNWLFHVLWVPPMLSPAAAAILVADNDAPGQNYATFRTQVGWTCSAAGPASAFLWDTNLVSGNAGGVGMPQLYGPPSVCALIPTNTLRPLRKFADDSYMLWDAWIGHADSSVSGTNKLRGRLWDCVGSSHVPALDSEDNFDNESWLCVARQSSATSGWIGSLHVRLP